MHRIDTPDAVAGRFNDNPAVQSPTTRVTAAFLNDVQENICEVIEAADIDLNKGDGSQLLAAIDARVAAGIAVLSARLNAERLPIGTVIQVDGPSPGGLYAPFNADLLRADWPLLVAYYEAQGRLIDGSTALHFRTPNYEGRFGRNIASDALVDPDGPTTPGLMRADQNKEHSHSLPVKDNPNAGLSHVEDADPGGATRSVQTGVSGGNEARPVSVVLRWMIRGRHAV